MSATKQPTKWKRWQKVTLTILLIFIVLIILVPKDNTATSSAANDATTVAPARVADMDVTAKKICADYEGNEVAADNVYKDHFVNITGKVESINKDFTDGAYVILSNGKEYSLSGAWCYPKDNNAVASLQKGQTVTFMGKVDGLIMGNVIIKNCTVK